MKALIAVLPGDGIGVEVATEGTRVLDAIGKRFGHEFELASGAIGGQAIDRAGEPLPQATIDLCKRSAAVLLGAVGGPKWETLEGKMRPEAGLLGLRKALGLFANIRPVAVHPKLAHASPLKPELLAKVDLVIVRELTGGLYFGEKKREGTTATDTCVYTEDEVARVARVAFGLARGRRKKVTSIDKANVLETSRLWREVVIRVQKEFPDVELSHELVDSAAMKLVKWPAYYDVIVTENMFGDILSDEASVLAGSIGLLPSASLGEGRRGLYEPIHGSAPDIAGKGIANPYGTILSVAMLLRHSLVLEDEARAVERAAAWAINRGILTPDLVTEGAAKTRDVTDVIIDVIARGGPKGG